MTHTPQETKVLIIEDEPMLLDIAATSFSRAGFQVLLAPDGPEACPGSPACTTAPARRRRSAR